MLVISDGEVCDVCW